MPGLTPRHSRVRTRSRASAHIVHPPFTGTMRPRYPPSVACTSVKRSRGRPIVGARGWRLWTTAVLALTTATACGAATQDVVVSGSSTVQPITSVVAEKFADRHQDVSIVVNGPGTGDGFELFCNGETDISDASRPIKDAEIEACRENDIGYVELKVAIDGLSLLTNPENAEVDCLSLDGLYALLGPESEGFDNWSDANELAEALGAPHAPYPDKGLTVTGPGEESGTFDTFVELVIEDLAEERGQEATTRADYTSSPNDNVIIEGVARSRGSLGWVGFAFFRENRDEVKALAIHGDGGCIEPTDEAIATGTYPLARPLFIYVNLDHAEEKPALQRFVDFYLSDVGREAVTATGYVALTEDDWDATREQWREVQS